MRLLIALFFSLNTYANLPPTTSKVNGESVFSTTFVTDYGTIPAIRVGTKITLGTIPVSAGGTGLATLTANNVILGNGTSAPSFVAPGSSGNILTSNGTTWTSAVPGTGTSQVTMEGETSPKVFYLNFGGSCNGNAGSGSLCTASPCTICDENGLPSGMTVTRTGAGGYRLTNIDGSKTICTGAGYGGGLTLVYQANNASNTTFYAFSMINAAGSGADSDNVSMNCSVIQ